MIHLINKIYADYDFSNSGVAEDYIVASSLGKLPFTGEKLPLETYTSLNDIFAQFGNIATFLEYLLPLDKKIIIYLSESDVHRMLVAAIKASMPNVSNTMLHRIVKFCVMKHRYVHSVNNNYSRDLRQRFAQLSIPSIIKSNVWAAEVDNHRCFDEHFKELISFEYLLAHVLSTNYDPNDRFTPIFTARLEKILWKSMAWDFDLMRQNILFGLNNIKANFGYEININGEHVVNQIAGYESDYLFNIDANASNTQWIKANYFKIMTLWDKLQQHNRTTNAVQDLIRQTLQPDRFTLDDAKQIIALDKTYHNTQVFGRSEFRLTMNTIFVGYLYNATPAQLQELRLC